MATHYLACDLGAESGRLMLGTIANDRLRLEEIHRFVNSPVRDAGALHWDVAGLFDELNRGLRRVAARRLPIASISADSWGVDYVLLDAAGKILPPTFHYRDSRCQRGVEQVYARVDWDTIFAETGIQFMAINTLFQLGAEAPERLRQARRILGIGDAFNFLLSGVARAEESLASTSQLYNPRTHAWSRRLLDALDLSPDLFPPIVPSGTRLGPLRATVAEAAGLPALEVLATCSHDTGAAVAAVPAEAGAGWLSDATGAPDWAYLSSGTWSLMGVELPGPIINEVCRKLNFTNETGYGGSIRLLKNIVGLWIVQECRRAWAEAGEKFAYATLTQLAAEATPFGALINPADPRFLSPGEMPAKVAAVCRETGQAAPVTPGATVRCVLESLALLYRRTLRQLEQLVGRRIERLHIVGGGSKNTLLDQFTANALQIPVWTGPAEATAAGNVLVQAITLGHLPSLDAARRLVRDSMEIQTVRPADPLAWAAASERFERVMAGAAR